MGEHGMHFCAVKRDSDALARRPDVLPAMGIDGLAAFAKSRAVAGLLCGPALTALGIDVSVWLYQQCAAHFPADSTGPA